MGDTEHPQTKTKKGDSHVHQEYGRMRGDVGLGNFLNQSELLNF